MKRVLTSKKIYVLFFIIFIIYALSILINQQIKLNSYANQKDYYKEELQAKKEKNEDLVSMQENVNSPEYIENIAREKLDMYYHIPKRFCGLHLSDVFYQPILHPVAKPLASC